MESTVLSIAAATLREIRERMRASKVLPHLSLAGEGSRIR